MGTLQYAPVSEQAESSLLQKRRQVMTEQPTSLALNQKHCEPG
jgi:hypothetical protein